MFLLGRALLAQLQGDRHHEQAVHRHRGPAVRLANIAARGQRLAEVNATVVSP